MARVYRLYFTNLNIRFLLHDGCSTTWKGYCYENAIYAHYEQAIIGLMGFLWETRFTVMISEGKDGDRASRITASTESTVLRGSSLHRGHRVLAELINDLNSHQYPAALSVDGPIGPAQVAKPGIVFCASRTGRPIIPVGLASKYKLKIPGTWSRMFFPFPFSKLIVTFGKPFKIPKNIGRQEIDSFTRMLSEQLLQEKYKAENALHCD